MQGAFIEIIGLIAGTLGVIAWIPQIKEVWIEGLHEGISFQHSFLSLLHLYSG